MGIFDFFRRGRRQATGQAERLVQALAEQPSWSAFRALADHFDAAERALPLDDVRLRTALFALSGDDLEPDQAAEWIRSLERLVVTGGAETTAHEWQRWLATCLRHAYRIPVGRPSLARALRGARSARRLDALDHREYSYLLSCYQQEYEQMLALLTPEARAQALPLLVALGELSQQLPPSEASARLLRTWAEGMRVYPRSLTAFTDDEARRAPARGPGSPHRIAITLYYESGNHLPTSIAYAGCTADPLINSRVLGSLYGLGLACDAEPTFTGTGAGRLTLELATAPPPSANRPPLVAACFGPGGLVEPTPGMPSLGMTVDEALPHVLEVLNQLHQATGLVQLVRWDLQDALDLEDRIRHALAEPADRSHVIRSEPTAADAACAVHVMPLLHRQADGRVAPISIPVPIGVIRSEPALHLLASTRHMQMNQLITAARQRLDVARQTYEETDELVRRWQGLPEAERNAICQRNPEVELNQQVDFEIGLVRPLVPPEKRDRREFEDLLRPELRDRALEFANRYQALHDRLESLNRPMGRADALALKLVVDTTLRRSPLPIENDELQMSYAQWASTCGLPIWAAVTDWAERRGLPIETLASDRVVFNARLDISQHALLLEPWVSLDMNDFLVNLDCQAGLMEVLPGGRVPSLEDAVVPDPEHEVRNLDELQQRFEGWAEQSLRLAQLRSSAPEATRDRILGDDRLALLLRLEQVRRRLAIGAVEDALEMLGDLRAQDVPVAYFWTAVAHQWKFLEAHYAAQLELAALQPQDRNYRLLATAAAMICGELSRPRLLDVDAERPLRHSDEPDGPPIDGRARDAADQLYGCCPPLANRLAAEPDRLGLVLSESLAVTPEETRRLHAALTALSSLDLIGLAQGMRDMAHRLGFEDASAATLRSAVEMVAEQARQQDYLDTSVTPHLEELLRRLDTPTSGLRTTGGHR